MDPAALVELFAAVAVAVRRELDALADWGRADGHPGQYRHDVVADRVAVPMLVEAGLGVLSEESGVHHGHLPVVAVIDPVDGSTNAAMGLPWFATSICAVDADGPLAALVVNQALGVSYTALRGEGAWRDGVGIAPSTCRSLGDSIVILNDVPAGNLGWRQYRVLGAAALDLCAVADGTADAFVDLSGGLAPWDHLGGLLVCREAGAAIGSLHGAEVLDASPDARPGPIAAATAPLLEELRRAVTA